MNKLETAIYLVEKTDAYHQELNDALDEALGYEVIFTVLTKRYHGTNTLHIWRRGEVPETSAKYLSYKNSAHWDEQGRFTREELNTIEEVMGS